jgi:hypothetical protein
MLYLLYGGNPMSKLNLRFILRTGKSVPAPFRLNSALRMLVLTTIGIALSGGAGSNWLRLGSLPFQIGTVAQAVPARGESWDKVWKVVLRQQKRRGGSRGDICVIAPARTPDPQNSAAFEVWSDRPLFLWQGAIKRIQVTDDNSNSLWNTTISDDRQSIVYAGKPLQPGQTYYWKVFNSASPQAEPRLILTFQIMEASVRDRISAELTTLETQLKSTGATAEDIALQRASYFANAADKNLSADALREMYSVKDPSDELKAILQGATAELCRSSNL